MNWTCVFAVALLSAVIAIRVGKLIVRWTLASSALFHFWIVFLLCVDSFSTVPSWMMMFVEDPSVQRKEIYQPDL